MAFSPTGRALALGGANVTIWDLESGELSRVVHLPRLSFEETRRDARSKDVESPNVDPDRKTDPRIVALAYSPDGRSLAAGCAGDGTVRIIDLEASD